MKNLILCAVTGTVTTAELTKSLDAPWQVQYYIKDYLH